MSNKAEIERLQARVVELESELARVQRLPELDWARACAALTSRLATLARSGEQPAATGALDVLDKLKTYVTSTLAARDSARAEVERLRSILIWRHCSVRDDGYAHHFCLGWHQSCLAWSAQLARCTAFDRKGES